MAPRTSPRRAAQDGFSLIEILVVTLIIGLLALIALPMFLGQRHKGNDAVAKHAASAVAVEIESCYATEQDYRQCDATSRLTDADVSFGSGPGQVEAKATGAHTYEVTSHSRSGTDFVLTRPAAGALQHTCTRSGADGCPTGGRW